MSGLNLDDFGNLIERPDSGVRRDAEERRERLVLPPGSLGRLDDLGEWLSAAQSTVPVRPVERPRVVLFAGDHGIAGLGVSGRPAGSAHELVRATLRGESAVAVLARSFGAELRVVDMALDCDPDSLPADVVRHRVRRGSGRIDIEDALTAEEAEQAFRAGMAVADEEADSGTDLVVLGDLSVGGTTPASTLIAALCGTDASVVTGRGAAGIGDLAWMRKCAAIRDALRRARPVLGDQLELLAAVGGADLAAITGFLLQCAVRRTPVILDGVVSAACALVGQRVAFRAPDWWLAGQRTGEPAQEKALDRMAMEPLLDHGVAVGEGAGALLALPMVRAAAALLAELPERERPEAEGTPAPGPGPDDAEPRDTAARNGEPAAGAGADTGATTDTGAAPDTGATTDTGATATAAETEATDDTTATDTGATPDSQATAETGTTSDTGTTAGTRTAAATGTTADTGTTPDTPGTPAAADTGPGGRNGADSGTEGPRPAGP